MTTRSERRDAGFTLAEIIIAVAITALISIVIGRTLTTGTSNLAGTYDNAAAAQQAIRFNSLIRYDFAGAGEITVFPATEPTDKSSICWSGPSVGSWNAVGDSPVVRPVVNINILQADQTADISNWWNTKTNYVGYEIRRGTGGLDSDLELWRVQCDGSLVVVASERVIRLGRGANSLVGGDTFIYCSGPSIVTSTSKPTSNVFKVNTVEGVAPTTSAATPTPTASIRAINVDRSGQSVAGLIIPASVNKTAGTITFSSPQTSPTTGWTPSDVSRWIIAKPCKTSEGIKRKNAAFFAVIPYSGVRDSIDTSSVIVLKSRVG